MPTTRRLAENRDRKRRKIAKIRKKRRNSGFCKTNRKSYEVKSCAELQVEQSCKINVTTWNPQFRGKLSANARIFHLGNGGSNQKVTLIDVGEVGNLNILTSLTFLCDEPFYGKVTPKLRMK